MAALQLSAEEFHILADGVADAAAEFLATLDSRPVFPPTSAVGTTATFDRPLPEDGVGRAVLDDLKEIAEHSRAGNGRLFAYVVGSGEPVGALADLYASVLNQNVTAWRSAPAAVTSRLAHRLSDRSRQPGEDRLCHYAIESTTFIRERADVRRLHRQPVRDSGAPSIRDGPVPHVK